MIVYIESQMESDGMMQTSIPAGQPNPFWMIEWHI